jgi:hypothetical protein
MINLLGPMNGAIPTELGHLFVKPTFIVLWKTEFTSLIESLNLELPGFFWLYGAAEVQGTLSMEMGSLTNLGGKSILLLSQVLLTNLHTNSVLFLNCTFGTESDEWNGSHLLRNWTFEGTEYVFHDYLICAFVAIRIRRIHWIVEYLHLRRNRLMSTIPTEVGQMGRSLDECYACVVLLWCSRCNSNLFCTNRKPWSPQEWTIGDYSIWGWFGDEFGYASICIHSSRSATQLFLTKMTQTHWGLRKQFSRAIYLSRVHRAMSCLMWWQEQVPMSNIVERALGHVGELYCVIHNVCTNLILKKKRR